MSTKPIRNPRQPEIKRLCESIRASWSLEVLARRAGVVKEDLVVPVVQRAEFVGAIVDTYVEEV